MDVVYPYIHSQWYGYELKYSIRSLAKFFFFQNIYVVGDRPGFFDYGNGLYHIPHADKFHSQKNIWDKVYAACLDHRISEDFLFINDDHFLLDFFEDMPYFHDGDLADKKWLNDLHRNPYFKIAKRTLTLLEEIGFPTLHYDIHTPMVINREKFILCYEYFSKFINSNEGIIMKTSYCNFFKIKGVFMEDLKLKARFDYGQIVRFTKNRKIFSVGEQACSGALLKFLAEKYPKQTIFEK